MSYVLVHVHRGTQNFTKIGKPRYFFASSAHKDRELFAKSGLIIQVLKLSDFNRITGGKRSGSWGK